MKIKINVHKKTKSSNFFQKIHLLISMKKMIIFKFIKALTIQINQFLKLVNRKKKIWMKSKCSTPKAALLIRELRFNIKMT